MKLITFNYLRHTFIFTIFVYFHTFAVAFSSCVCVGNANSLFVLHTLYYSFIFLFYFFLFYFSTYFVLATFPWKQARSTLEL